LTKKFQNIALPYFGTEFGNVFKLKALKNSGAHPMKNLATFCQSIAILFDEKSTKQNINKSHCFNIPAKKCFQKEF
jgi:hypothetical protein